MDSLRAKILHDAWIWVEGASQRPAEVSLDASGPFEMLWVMTNGKVRRQLLWVRAIKTGIYVAQGIGPGTIHTSYHVDGAFHTKECLEGLAAAAAGQGDFVRGARLFAAAETLRETLGHVRLPPFQADHEQRVDSTCAALGETAFAAAWAEGRAMTLEEAIEYALAGETD